MDISTPLPISLMMKSPDVSQVIVIHSRQAGLKSVCFVGMEDLTTFAIMEQHHFIDRVILSAMASCQLQPLADIIDPDICFNSPLFN